MRDRDLVRLHWPPLLRESLDLLLALDDRLADVALTAREPALGAIKLAWWRDSLAALATQPPPPEPLLEAVASQWVAQGRSVDGLSDLADAWLAILDEQADPVPRGHAMFTRFGELLGQRVKGGEAWSRADLARRTGEPQWLRPLDLPASPRKSRPASMFDRLGVRDAMRPWPPEPEATPGRSWTIIRHRLTGR